MGLESFFGFGNKGEIEKHKNEGGNFIAIPKDQNLGTTEEEAEIIARNKDLTENQ